MQRKLSNDSSLENLRKEAKRWLRALRAGNTAARRRLEVALPNPPIAPVLRDVQHALAREYGFDGWTAMAEAVERRRALLAQGADSDTGQLDAASLARDVSSGTDNANRIERFLPNACRDWRSGGGRDVRMALHTASRMLSQFPELADENIFTAVVCGNAARVEHLLAGDRSLAVQGGGPRNWPPLLYLASARLLQPDAAAGAVQCCQLLLDHGADPNAFYTDGEPGREEQGNHFTLLTCIAGRGEQQLPPHPYERELTRLLLHRGAEPYDAQLLYNVFADHGSRLQLTDDIVWLLQMMYEQSVKLGRAADWNDPAWSMLSMGGYTPASYHLLHAAVTRGLPGLTEWLLQHGAGPNTRAARGRIFSESLFESYARGVMGPVGGLLLQYGADPISVAMDAHETFVVHVLDGHRGAAADSMRFYPEYRTDPHALFAATQRDNADAVRLLLELGVSPDVQAKDGSGRHALHVAAFAGAVHAARVLLEAGASADIRDRQYGATPMGFAAWAQQAAMTDVLAEFSRDVFNLVPAGKTARVRQVLRESPELARSLNSEGQSLLFWLPDDEAAAHELTELLLSHGTDVRVRDARGETARDVMERRAMTGVAELLRP